MLVGRRKLILLFCLSCFSSSSRFSRRSIDFFILPSFLPSFLPSTRYSTLPLPSPNFPNACLCCWMLDVGLVVGYCDHTGRCLFCWILSYRFRNLIDHISISIYWLSSKHLTLTRDRIPFDQKNQKNQKNGNLSRSLELND